MRTYWATVVTVSAAFVLVGVLVGSFVDTANDAGVSCGAPFSAKVGGTGGGRYGDDCLGARAQARQLPVALILLGATGVVIASGAGLLGALRRGQVREQSAAGS